MLKNNDLTGQLIDHYHIDKHLAQGGMADVYLATDTELQRRIAFKIMLNTLAQDKQFVDRFRREAQAAAQLEHPNIVQIYDTGLFNGIQPYIAMQYIDGGSLHEALDELRQQDKLFPTVQALWLVKQIADALNVAHQAGIVHRDIKPNNVLLRRDGTPVLTDLGIAAISGATRLTRTGSIMGTPHYMSPEQIRGKPVDGRCDIYSLGVVLYELLAGDVPFTGEDSMAILHKQAYDPPPPLSSLRTGLTSQTHAVVNRCLQKEPNLRFQNVPQLIDALEQAIAAEAAGSWISPTGSYKVPPMGHGLVDRDATVLEPVATAAQLSNTPSGRVAGRNQDINYQSQHETESQKRKPPWWLLLVLLLVPIAALALILIIRPWEGGSADNSGPESTIVALALTVTSQAEANFQNNENPESARSESGAIGVDSVNVVDLTEVSPTPLEIQPTPEPTATSVPPTPTPEPTPTTLPPTPTPEPTLAPPTATPEVISCAVAVHPAFTSIYDDRLGCATGNVSAGIWIATERFEGGRMIWRSDNDKIYAVYNNGSWSQYDDIWVEGQPSFTCGVEQSPPTPQRGFGKIWCTHDRVRNGLGNAVEAEYGVDGTLQNFSNGFILQLTGVRTYTFYYNGGWK
jgi:eukaryotic-like serine/threonine-protein kinase